jgi:DNA-3-methyladenine glycosylase I
MSNTTTASGAAPCTATASSSRIVRHRGKIEAAIANAVATRALHERGETLDALLWSFAPERDGAAPPASGHEVPASTPESKAMAKELKRRGFRFVGPTTAYALMQAAGLVNDHLKGCELRELPEIVRAGSG